VAKYPLRILALVYLLFLLVLPVGLVVWRTFDKGLGRIVDVLTSPNFTHAFAVTLSVSVWAVLANTVLATIFVSLPLVVRAIVPVLEEMGDEQEQAAHTLGASRWQSFRRITVPGIRAALGYGVVLCLARALGEYGAVAVVSGRLVGQTQTATLYVEERYQNYDQTAAFTTATALALIAIVILLITKLLRPKEND
jgi:ABC-type sulfate transport system permease subunit